LVIESFIRLCYELAVTSLLACCKGHIVESQPREYGADEILIVTIAREFALL